MALLEAHDPRRYTRLRRDVRGILVHGTVGARATWLPSIRLIMLRENYVTAPGTTAADLASTLVHEGTHAWLDRHGFEYRPDRRARIEAICFRSEIAFARRLPNGAEVIARAERQLVRDPAYWTNEAFRDRHLAELRELGVPRWIIVVVDWLGRRLNGRADR